MANRLADAVSPYLRSHADNPVDWWQWGPEPFAEASRREVPVLVSIGYATCHWCHVMARESFSDPALAQYLNEHYVSIKVDREEHPDVDASYLAAASAFTENLGWPLNVFLTPEGKVFYGGTYFPPVAMAQHPSFRQVLEAIATAWTDHRAEVENTAAAVVAALAGRSLPAVSELPTDFAGVVRELEGYEDAEYGGFGGAPKFPVAPVLLFLLSARAGERGNALALRTLERLVSSGLRDPVEGGFFRYATMRDWTDPHYERMLYDNALLLDAYTSAWKLTGARWAAAAADGIANFLENVLQLPSGGFASAQDSESVVDGELTEGDYYSLTAAERAHQTPPQRDEKVLAGWNGLAISALAKAGFAFERADWLRSAQRSAEYLLELHVLGDGRLVRASIAGRTSAATATLEDYGMLAQGLFDLALTTGEVAYAVAGRGLIEASMRPLDEPAIPFTVPGGPDPVLASQGTALAADPSEGAYPSGLTACSAAAHTLYLLTAERRYLDAACATMGTVAAPALARPIGFGGALRLMAELASEPVQLVVVTPQPASDTGGTSDRPVLAAARTHPATLVASVTEPQASAFSRAGFELFDARTATTGEPTAYLCREFVCRLPTTDARQLR